MSHQIVSVVDDDASVRNAIATLIRSFGWQVRQYASGRDFLQALPQHQSACLISDVQMQDINGIDLQEHLIARGQCPPIIFITGFPTQSGHVRAMQNGARAFLTKPADAAELLQLLESILGSRPVP
jgi:FixJ family two-component response regulator